MPAYTQQDLLDLKPTQGSFVGVDSDGCVFDTMEAKQKRFFHPEIVATWALERIEREVRETAEFVSLYSRWRGSNRFVALVKVFELLAQRPEVARSGVTLPETAMLRRYVDSGLPLSNATLDAEVRRTGDPELGRVLAWSLAVNAGIDARMGEIPPFRHATECLEKIAAHSDLLVVSQTPEEALVKEWNLHGLARHAAAIAGQELGTKGEQLRMAAGGKYPPDRMLMVGDALGDLEAASQAGARFFPIEPGREEVSWERLLSEAYDRFLSGAYAGPYEEGLIAAFEVLLPETPPWRL